LQYVQEHDEGIDVYDEGEPTRTKIIEVHPKTIITKNNSPDVPFDFSINPYQGCEHGCVYCYARTTHEYWGYNAGKDFERVILVKKEAPILLEKEFRKKSYQPKLIVLSGNTDCYQPIERKLGITRKLLEVFQQFKHPVGMITKNSLIQRDIDILQDLASINAASVVVSLTSLREETRRLMEPRTASVKQRLQTIEKLTAAGIPVRVNLAPIIPAINSDEVFDLVKAAADHGALSVNYILVRLNGAIGPIFEDWVQKVYPERAEKVLNLIKETHSGTLNESRFKTRMKGEGVYAEQVKSIFDIACRKFLPKKVREEMDYSRFMMPGMGRQMGMFD
jgi:DNA repair photolyase